MFNIERVTDVTNMVGESPLWHAAESALYWVDIPAKKIFRLNIASGRVDVWQTGAMIGCIAMGRNGTLVAGMEDGFYELQLAADGNVLARQLAAVTMPMANMRFNDGRCDRQGRFWAGTMHTNMAAAHAVGALFRCDSAGELLGPIESGLVTQNGLAWSPAGDMMYLSDSHPTVRRIWAFDYDIDAGAAHNRRVFVDMNLHSGRPDGAAVDVDGCYWICANDAGRILRFTPQGKLDRSIDLPVKKPAMCAFGGAALDTLYVTSIRPDGVDLSDQPMAGGVFALQPGVCGLPEAVCR